MPQEGNAITELAAILSELSESIAKSATLVEVNIAAGIAGVAAQDLLASRAIQ